MATLISFRPSGIRASASSGHHKSDQNRRKNTSTNWWTPLFGWQSDPNYFDDDVVSLKAENVSESDLNPAPVRSRFALGSFTEEKAKRLRMKTMETATFHDIMYHSAIASRLASDLPNGSDL